MIVSALIYIIGFFIAAWAFVLPNFSLWPAKVFTAFEYLVQPFGDLAHVFPPLFELYEAIDFFLTFLIYFITIRLFIKLLNYIRGAGQGLE